MPPNRLALVVLLACGCWDRDFNRLAGSVVSNIENPEWRVRSKRIDLRPRFDGPQRVPRYRVTAEVADDAFAAGARGGSRGAAFLHVSVERTGSSVKTQLRWDALSAPSLGWAGPHQTDLASHPLECRDACSRQGVLELGPSSLVGEEPLRVWLEVYSTRRYHHSVPRREEALLLTLTPEN